MLGAFRCPCVMAKQLGFVIFSAILTTIGVCRTLTTVERGLVYIVISYLKVTIFAPTLTRYLACAHGVY